MTNNNNTKAGFQDLPGEILNKVAGYLDTPSFSALRLTSSTVEANTYQNFIDRNFKHLKVDVDLPSIREVLSKLRSATNVAPQVEAITFRGTKSKPQEHEIDEVDKLLRQIFDLVPSNKVNIVGGPALAQVLPILIETSAPNLTSLSIQDAQIPAVPFQNVLNRQKESLRSLSLERVGCTDPSWLWTLLAIKDQLNLDTLAMNQLLSNDRDMYVCFLQLPERRKTRAMRDTVTKKVEHYAIDLQTVRMLGKTAVKEGLEYILARLTQYHRTVMVGL